MPGCRRRRRESARKKFLAEPGRVPLCPAEPSVRAVCFRRHRFRCVCESGPAASSSPMPRPSTPTLLLMVVRFFTPLRTRARIRFSGIPHSPNPPTMMVAPSKISLMASSALATTLFIGTRILKRKRPPQRHGDTEAIQVLRFSVPPCSPWFRSFVADVFLK